MSKLASHTIAIFPLLMALKKFEERGITGFEPDNPSQKYLLERFPEALKVKYSEDQIKSFISDSAKELNTILKQNGFTIELDETQPFDLGVVTIMDLVGKWLGKAMETTVSHENITYPACFIKTGTSIITIGDKTILKIITTNGLTVFIEKTKTERSGLALFEHLFNQARLINYSEQPCEATVPFVNMSNQPDISWMEGMYATSANFAITQALQENRLQINLDGIHAESATALGGVRGISSPKPQFVVNQPFNVWIAYGDPELQYFPLFCACVGTDSWKK